MVVQLQLDHKVSGMKVLTINNTINVIDEMLELFEIMNNADLLKNPMISIITERYVVLALEVCSGEIRSIRNLVITDFGSSGF
jgi:hypothetical protein